MNTHGRSMNDRHDERDEALLGRIRSELDRSCEALDGHTLSRLNSMRNAVLEGRRKRHPLLLPFGGLVTACVLVLTVSLYYHPATAPEQVQGSTPLEDIEILSSSDSLDFYEEYDFYQWLAENDTSI